MNLTDAITDTVIKQAIASGQVTQEQANDLFVQIIRREGWWQVEIDSPEAFMSAYVWCDDDGKLDSVIYSLRKKTMAGGWWSLVVQACFTLLTFTRRSRG